MSLLEKQTALGKNLYQINAESLRSLVELQRDNLEQYFELNKIYLGKLPRVGGIKNFLDLQREYNQNIWEGVKTSIQARTEIVKDALQESSAAVKATYQREKSSDVEKTEIQATSKAKPTVKTVAKKVVAKPVVKAAAKPAVKKAAAKSAVKKAAAKPAAKKTAAKPAAKKTVAKSVPKKAAAKPGVVATTESAEKKTVKSAVEAVATPPAVEVTEKPTLTAVAKPVLEEVKSVEKADNVTH